MFEAFGQVELVQLPLDESGHCKGFGFVQVNFITIAVLSFCNFFLQLYVLVTIAVYWAIAHSMWKLWMNLNRGRTSIWIQWSNEWSCYWVLMLFYYMTLSYAFCKLQLFPDMYLSKLFTVVCTPWRCKKCSELEWSIRDWW